MEWISVKDGLPETGTDVLIFAVGKIDGFFGETAIKITHLGNINPFTWLDPVIGWVSPSLYFFTDYKITHWMPLPEPPKEE